MITFLSQECDRSVTGVVLSFIINTITTAMLCAVSTSSAAVVEEEHETWRDRIEVGSRIQLRGVWNEGAEEEELGIPRARFSLDAKIADRLMIESQFAFEKGPAIKDVFLTWQVSERARIDLGRRKLPTYREFITSSGRLLLVERSMSHSAFDGDRGDGIAVSVEEVGGSRFSYVFGAWRDITDRTGARERAVGIELEQNAFEPIFAARLEWKIGQDRAGRYDQAAFDGETWGVGLGLSGYHSVDTARDGGARTRAALDHRVTVQRLSWSGALHAAAMNDGAVLEPDAIGLQQTIGYVVRPWFAPALRGEVLKERDAQMLGEATIGANLMAPKRKHALKLTLDASARTDASVRARAMLQFAL